MSLNELFKSLFITSGTQSIPISGFFLSMIGALVLGLFLAICYTYRARYSKSFFVTLAILPAVVAMVIMMVNGNLGAGIAVSGAFSLVRFRSVPGSAREIGAIFLAMVTGLTIGMGYIAFAACFAVLVSVVTLLYNRSSLGIRNLQDRTLHITIPEDLNYTDAFVDLFQKYTTHYELTDVKTSSMGSLFRLAYNIRLRDPAQEKAFIDDLRCRNGNLEISSSRQVGINNEL